MTIGKWRARQTVKWLRSKARGAPRGAAVTFLEESMTEADLAVLKQEASDLLAFEAQYSDGNIVVLALGVNIQAGFSAMCLSLKEMCDDADELARTKLQLSAMRTEILEEHGVAVTSEVFDFG